MVIVLNLYINFDNTTIHNINIANLEAWIILPFSGIFFGFFFQCLQVLNVEVFHSFG